MGGGPTGRRERFRTRTMLTDAYRKERTIMTRRDKTATVKFVPVEKLSKKARRELDAKRRGSWCGLDPTTRVVPNKKAYDRNRSKRDARAALCA